MSANTSDTRNKVRSSGDELPNDAKLHAASGSDNIRSDLRAFVSDVEDLVKSLAHVTDADITRVRVKVEDALSNARQTIGKTAKLAQDRTKAAASATDDYVRGRPWTFIGVAAAIGVLLGFIASRRKDPGA